MKIKKLARLAGAIIICFSFALASGCDTVSGLLGLGGETETKEVASKDTPTDSGQKQTGGADKDVSEGQGSATGDEPEFDEEIEEKTEEPWDYIPEEKKDPFEVPDPPEIPAGNTAGVHYELDQLLLVGIIKGSGYDTAYIRLPTGEGKMVNIGEKLGKMGGKVTEIRKDEIVIEETYMKRGSDALFTIKKRMPMVELQTK